MSALKAFLTLSLFWLASVAGTPLAKASSLETRAVPVPQDGNYQILSCGSDVGCSAPQAIGVGPISKPTRLIQVGLTTGSTTWSITAVGNNVNLGIDGAYAGTKSIMRNTPVYATQTQGDSIPWTFIQIAGTQTYVVQADTFTDYFWTVNPNPVDPNYPEIIFDYLHTDYSGQYFTIGNVPA